MASASVLIFLTAAVLAVVAYDPEDKELDKVLPSRQGKDFEAFYPRKAYGVVGGASRPAHGHATYYSHRHPAIVDAPNPAAFGFRFDGARRFTFD